MLFYIIKKLHNFKQIFLNSKNFIQGEGEYYLKCLYLMQLNILCCFKQNVFIIEIKARLFFLGYLLGYLQIICKLQSNLINICGKYI